MQNDPIGDKGGSLNWYLYVANGSVNMSDITGKSIGTIGCNSIREGQLQEAWNDVVSFVNSDSKCISDCEIKEKLREVLSMPITLFCRDTPGVKGGIGCAAWLTRNSSTTYELGDDVFTKLNQQYGNCAGNGCLSQWIIHEMIHAAMKDAGRSDWNDNSIVEPLQKCSCK
jgi:hypothetical protein